MFADKTDQREEGRRRYLDQIRGTARPDAPNVVLVFVDDMGHGDLSCYGSTAIHTPNLDALAEGGARLTNFYASSPVCTPSRYSCLTGRYPTRGFMHGVFFPSGTPMAVVAGSAMFPRGVNGILPDEITVADALASGGYRTGLFGKWHLGDRSPHLPTEMGFDHFYGSYYSNDMKPYAFYRNDQIDVEAPVEPSQITPILTREICDFIDDTVADAAGPFFVHYASPYPHDPVAASDAFRGSSNAGTYGDCVQELDWSVGQIIDKLTEHDLIDDTIIIFTSDNGPWWEGSPGFHRGRKANSFDGGQVVPLIASFPGRIPQGIVVDHAAMNLDFLPTFLNLAGIALPDDRIIDGVDIIDVLAGISDATPHDELLMIKGKKVAGLRTADDFKYLARARTENSSYFPAKHGPFLFNLTHDRNESYDVSDHHPEKAKDLEQRLERARSSMESNPRGWL